MEHPQRRWQQKTIRKAEDVSRGFSSNVNGMNSVGMRASRGANVMLVDDDSNLLRLLALRLTAAGYTVNAVESGAEALASIAAFHPHVVVTDLRMEDMDGMALFEAIHQRHPTLPVIMLTAHGTIPDAVNAVQLGVFEYLTKPCDHESLLDSLERALKMVGETDADASEGTASDWRKRIVSRSPLMDSVLQQARMAAENDSPILIHGESGTGKELLAHAIHDASPRRQRPFISIDCGSVTNEAGDTGRAGQRGAWSDGTFSHGGTVFLDEIADLPVEFQAALLRRLQEQEARSEPASHAAADARLITATRKNLEQAVAEGVFREDLFYRLKVITLELPNLMQRREDIPSLAAHFLAELSESTGKDVRGFSPKAMEWLLAAEWPGNIRQLRNVVHQSAALATTPIIPLILVQRALSAEPGEIPSFAEARRRFELEYLTQLLQITQGNVSIAARMARRNRTEFYKLLQRHHIDPQLFRS